MGIFHSQNQGKPVQVKGLQLRHSAFAQTFPDLCTQTEVCAFPDSRAVLLNTKLADCFDGAMRGAMHGDMLAQPLKGLIATAYSGHQFGQYSESLGDGRAALLGDVGGFYDPDVEVQLKGAGKTSFSRPGTDGRATLASVLREYIVSEAMHALGIDTTRALAAFRTGDSIVRRGASQPAGILVRTAVSHIRIGTFQYVAKNHPDQLQKLVEYTNIRHWMLPTLDHQFPTLPDRFVANVADRYATLVAKWMSVGFIHGVMNTDNASVGGLTIDYGPCAFLDEYLASKVFSEIDKEGRYAFKNQPRMARWNLGVLADALNSLLTVSRASIQEYFDKRFEHEYYREMSLKLGLREDLSTANRKKLVDPFLDIMEAHGLDFTNTFRQFADTQTPPSPMFNSWAVWWSMGREPDEAIRQDRMQRSCPIYIPRNHLVQESIHRAVEGDCRMMRHLIQVLMDPFTLNPHAAHFRQPPTDAERVTKTTCGT